MHGVKTGARVGAFALDEPLSADDYSEYWHATRADGTLRSPRESIIRLAAPRGNLVGRGWLREEYDILRELTDERIPRPLGFFAGEGALILEYVDGVGLDEIIEAARRGHVDIHPGTAVDMTLEVAQALHAIYGVSREGKHLGHGHLSPSQVLLTPTGALKILGFGAQPRTQRPPFSPPEGLGSDTPTTLTDQWSTGALLCALATASLSAETPAAELPVQNVPPAFRHSVRQLAHTHRTLAQVCAKALSTDPELRFHSGSDLLKALYTLFREIRLPSQRRGLVPRVRAKRHRIEETEEAKNMTPTPTAPRQTSPPRRNPAAGTWSRQGHAAAEPEGPVSVENALPALDVPPPDPATPQEDTQTNPAPPSNSKLSLDGWRSGPDVDLYEPSDLTELSSTPSSQRETGSPHPGAPGRDGLENASRWILGVTVLLLAVALCIATLDLL